MNQQGAQVTRTYSDLILDPRYGPAVREVWRGHKPTLLALAASYAAAGLRAEYSDNEGAGILTVTLAQGADATTPEVPTDTWEIITESDQRTIWDNKRLFDRAGGSMETLAYWRKRTQNALVGNFAQAGSDPVEYEALNPNSHEPLTPAEAGFSANGPEPYLYKIYLKLLRGEDSFEYRRTTLKLSRVVTSNYAKRAVIDPIEKVYTTEKLRTTFDVPDSVYRLLPATPGANLTPPDTAWSWKLRQDSYQIVVSANKVQETRDWIFAAWDTDAYELVS